MLTSVNHITLAVRNVDVSLNFYAGILGFTPRAKWKSGAYLSLGELWLCLSVDDVAPKQDYTHYAFTIAEDAIPAFRMKLQKSGVVEWKNNHSEGESIYFLDPDGHKLEVHCGSLKSRLMSCQETPYDGMIFFE